MQRVCAAVGKKRAIKGQRTLCLRAVAFSQELTRTLQLQCKLNNRGLLVEPRCCLRVKTAHFLQCTAEISRKLKVPKQRGRV